MLVPKVHAAQITNSSMQFQVYNAALNTQYSYICRIQPEQLHVNPEEWYVPMLS